MKRIVLLTLLLIMTLSVTGIAAKTTFSDLPETHWAHSTVMPMVEKGLFNGTSAIVDGVGTFSPDKPMTRAEFIAVLCRQFFPTEKYIPAQDIPWWDPYFTVAVMHDLIDYQNEFIQMDVEITRAEAALLIQRVMEEAGLPINCPSLSAPYDYNVIEQYDKEIYDGLYGDGSIEGAVRSCIGAGIIGGVDEKGTFDPYGKLTRAAAATILCRLTDESRRITTGAVAEIKADREAHLENCKKGNHFFTTWSDTYYKNRTEPTYEVIKYATPTEDGIYRLNCMFCDHYIDLAFKKHYCWVYPSSTPYKRDCLDNHWEGYNCRSEQRYSDISDSLHNEIYGEPTSILIKCEKEFSEKYTDEQKALATHEFTEWGISAYPGRGVEGKLERMCMKCGYRNYKALPMYSTIDSSLDVRDSYFGERFGSGAPQSDAYAYTNTENLRYVRRTADFSKSLLDNIAIFNEYIRAYDSFDKFDVDGIYSYVFDRYKGPRVFKFIEGKNSDRFGINVFSWRDETDNSQGVAANDMSFAFEGFYFVTEDREIAQALWHLTDLKYMNGKDAVTDATVKSYGFKILSKSASSMTLEIKGMKVVWEWGGDIVGDNFYFSK